VRFLRAILELSGVDLARVMGASPVSISRWENGRAPIGVQADKLLRMLVAALPGQDVYSIEDLQGAASSKASSPLRIRLRLRKTGWTPVAA
jgi:transcriptional regulator with XRE-family HTH domain